MYRPQRVKRLIFCLILVLVLSMIGYKSRLFAQTPTIPPTVQRLVPQIISKKPHNPAAFTQGLVWDNGVFYESAGLYGQSTLRKVEIETGLTLQEARIGDRLFAEGLTLINNQLIQITWLEHIAFRYDRDSFMVLGAFSYDGEGWGICHDGAQFYMSNGSSNITVRDLTTFAPVKEIPVTLADQPVTNLNELECVGDSIYANIWMTPYIYRIDKATGKVSAVIDTSSAGLLTPEEQQQAGPDGVLNGIAYNPTTDTFYITGKLWPWLYEVKFVPSDF